MQSTEHDIRISLGHHRKDRKRLHRQLSQPNRGGLSKEQAKRLKLLFKRKPRLKILAMSKEETNAYYEKRTEAILEMQKAMARNEQNLREKKNIEKFEAEVLRKVKQDRERERAAEENGEKLEDEKEGEEEPCQTRRIVRTPEPVGSLGAMEEGMQQGLDED